MLKKFQKLQNITLRKMLDIFKISLINILKLEAFISSSKIRFERICKNYAWRALQIHENYLIRKRVSSGSPPYLNKIELDWEQFQDWNERENSQADYIQIKSDLDMSTRPNRRKKEEKLNIKKKYFNYLI